MTTELSRGDDLRRYLGIYVADHSAAATAGVALTRRCLRSNEGTALGDTLRQLLRQIEEDATTLAAMRTELNLKDAPFKRAVALVGERLARVKLNGHLVGYSPLSRLLEIEAILTGIDAKRSLWLALQQHAQAAALDRFDLSELVTRAEKQRSVLRPHHLDAAAAAFRLAGEPSCTARETGGTREGACDTGRKEST